MTVSRLVLHLHGSPRLERPDGRAVALSARESALLAWLHLEGPTPRGALAGRLWPGGDDARARTNLRQLLLRLKRSAGPVLDEGDGLLRLATGVRVADGTGRLLGPLEFDDAPELAEWLEARRDADRRTRVRDGLAAARDAMEADRLDAALAAADAVLLADPAVEEAHRLRMAAFWRRGDRAAAIQAWDDCRTALRRQFGVAPSAATHALGHRILADEAARGPASAGSGDGMPPALRRPPRLVGRDAEVARLLDALRSGHGAVVHGPGGVGKSRLMAVVADAMEPSLAVGGRPGDEHVPGAVASRLVSAAVARFDPVLDAVTRADIHRLLPHAGAEPVQLRSALEHRRVLASVARTMLACHARGMRLVVVDDLQFADDLSMEAIAVVIGGWLADPPERAAVPLFGCRTDELREPARRLVHLLEASGRSLRVDLRPLDADTLAALLATLPLPPSLDTQRPALARALHARVGGNPAHLLESVKSLWRAAPARWEPGDPLPLPEGLRAQLRQRLDRLTPPALQLAQLAAVAQRDFTLPLAAASLGRPPLGLAPLFAELDAAEVFQDGGFAHDLVAEAVDASLPVSLRAPLHRLVADHLRAHDGEPGSVAHHLDAAGDPVGAATWHLRAAEQARDQWRPADAARHFEAAARGLVGAVGADARARRLDGLRGAASARIGLGQMVAADALLDEAEGLCVTTADAVGVLASRLTAWLALHRLAPLRAGADRLLGILAQPPAGLPARERDRAWMALAAAARLTRAGPRALALVTQAREPAATLPVRLATGMLRQLNGDPLGAREELVPAIREAVDARLYAPAFNASHQLARAALALGDEAVFDEALTTLDRCRRDLGMGPTFTADVRQLDAMRQLARGEAARAWDTLAEARALRAGPGGDPARMPLQMEVLAAAALLAMDRVDEAAAHLDGLPLPDDDGPDADQACRAWVAARVAARRGGDVAGWLACARRHDPNAVDGADPLELRCLVASLDPTLSGSAREAAREAAWVMAQAAGRWPLGAWLGRGAAGRGGWSDPWLGAP